jgi:hypothetical protein
MPALNFQPRFAALVQRGEKRQTIRLPRRQPIRVGQMLYLYTGLRTKQARLLREAVCTSVGPVEITDGIHEKTAIPYDPGILYVNGMRIGFGKDAFARADGFDSWADMVAWFKSTHGLPFHGHLITW